MIQCAGGGSGDWGGDMEPGVGRHVLMCECVHGRVSTHVS